jgi:hypothetical protein
MTVANRYVFLLPTVTLRLGLIESLPMTAPAAMTESLVTHHLRSTCPLSISISTLISCREKTSDSPSEPQLLACPCRTPSACSSSSFELDWCQIPDLAPAAPPSRSSSACSSQPLELARTTVRVAIPASTMSMLHLSSAPLTGKSD